MSFRFVNVYMPSIMIFFPLALLITVSMIDVTCFQDPQPYFVQMYHHQSLTMTQEEEATENEQFYVIAENKPHDEHNRVHHLHNNIKSKRREKRQQEPLNDQQEDSPDYEQQYSQSLETKKGHNKSEEYDYEKLKNEYYNDESTEEAITNIREFEEYEDTYTTKANTDRPFHNSENQTNTPMENYCSVVLLFRIRVVQCFLFGVTHGKRDFQKRAGWVIAFWFTVCMSAMGYLWCTKGWCCCCCPCLFCQPHSVIQEAKQFLSKNSPGKAYLAQGETINYYPTSFEVLCYKDVERNVFNF